jgi:hypothetical protein
VDQLYASGNDHFVFHLLNPRVVAPFGRLKKSTFYLQGGAISDWGNGAQGSAREKNKEK